MNYNYHTHTPWCGHGKGEPEEYIKNAIRGGIRYMGFSDHAPWIFPDGYESGYRVPMKDAESYITELRELRNKYHDQIQLHIGFEMEYYAPYFEDMFKTVKNLGAEYLILGGHFAGVEHPNGHGSQDSTDDPALLSEYVENVISGMKTGIFTYVCHPDVFLFTGDEQTYLTEMGKICQASAQYNVPLEINLWGIFRGRSYPDPRFWKLAGEAQCPVTFGCDAHFAEKAAFDTEIVGKAEALVKDYGLNYIGCPKLVLIQDL